MNKVETLFDFNDIFISKNNHIILVYNYNCLIINQK